MPAEPAILAAFRGRDVTELSFFERAASFSVTEIAALTGAEPSEGADLARRLTGVAPVDLAEAGDLTFVSETKFIAALKATRAGAVLTNERFAGHVPEGIAVLRVRKPYDAFVTVARKIYSGSLRPTSVSTPRASHQARSCILPRNWPRVSRSIPSR